MARLRTLLGEDEMARAGGNWRENWVRKHPALVERGLNDLDCEIKEGRDKNNRGAWLVDLLKRWKDGKRSAPTIKTNPRNAGLTETAADKTADVLAVLAARERNPRYGRAPVDRNAGTLNNSADYAGITEWPPPPELTRKT